MPRSVKVWLKVELKSKSWLPKKPASLVTVCAASASRLVQVTVLPTDTVAVAGKKVRPPMITSLTLCVRVGAAVVAADGAVTDGAVADDAATDGMDGAWNVV